MESRHAIREEGLQFPRTSGEEVREAVPVSMNVDKARSNVTCDEMSLLSQHELCPTHRLQGR